MDQHLLFYGLQGLTDSLSNRGLFIQIDQFNDQCFPFARAGALVQWLKLPDWKGGDRGFDPNSGLQVSKKQTVSSPLTRKDSILWRALVTER